MLKNGPIFPISVLFASFLPKYKKKNSKRHQFLFVFIGFVFSEILLTSQILKLWRQITADGDLLWPKLTFFKSLHENEQVESFSSISIENPKQSKMLDLLGQVWQSGIALAA